VNPTVLRGQPLTGREFQVLAQIANGWRNHEIAAALELSEETIKSHLRHILVKLGANNRAHAVAIGFRQGLLA